MFLCSVKQFRQKQQRPRKSSLVIGRIPVLEALQEGKQLDRIYMQTNLHGDVAEEIKSSIDYVVQWRQDDKSVAEPSQIIRWRNGEVEFIRR